MSSVLNLEDLKVGLSRRTVREQVAQRIAKMIQSGLLRPGDELPSERELTVTLEVSRETVRGAIQMLAAVGMVEISQGSRTRVVGTEGFPDRSQASDREVSRRSADKVYEARLLVELPAVRLAVERIDEAGIGRLRRLVDAQSQMTDDPVRFQISDAEFHDLIYRAAGNSLIAEFLHETYSFGLEYRRLVLLGENAVALSLQDHTEVLEGFERRDAVAAVEAMERHLNRIHLTTLEAMASLDRTNR